MRLFAFFGSLILLALIAALVVPPYIEWDQFKHRFEREATRALGQPVVVRGTTSARLLPLPSVTFTDMRIGDEASDAPHLTAESFRLDIELAPLLKGDFVIVDMQLVRPKVELSLDKKGRLKLPPLTGKYARVERDDVAVENISVVDGLLRLRDARYGRETIVKNIQASASARSLTGPWRMQGIGEHDGERFRLGVSTGQWQDSGQIRLGLKLEPQSLPYDIEYDGPLLISGDLPRLKGLVQLSPMDKQSDKDLIGFRRPGRDQALPIRLEGDLELISGGATVPAFKLDIGARDDPYTITGSGQALFGDDVSFRVRAEGQQINVERLAKPGGDAPSGATFSNRLAEIRGLISKIPQFDLDGEINLFLPAVISGDTAIREVGMDLRPAESGAGWQIGNFEAQLPGRTELRADGLLSVGEEFGYTGDLIIASRQPSGLAKWLGSTSVPAIRDLANAGFSARTTISKNSATFEDVEIVLDGESLKGSIKRTWGDNQRPKLFAKLAGGAVDFDQLSGLIGLFAGGDEFSSVNSHNLELDLKTSALSYSGLLAKDFAAKLMLEEDSLTLDNVTMRDVAGSALSISGSITNFSTKPVGALDGSLVSTNPLPLLRVLKSKIGPIPFLSHFEEFPDSIANSDVRVRFDGESDKASFKVGGKTGGSEIDATLTSTGGEQLFSRQHLQGKMILVNEDASLLLSQLGLPVLPLEGTGRGAFRTSIVGTLDAGLKTDSALTLREGYLSASGLLKPNFVNDVFSLEGEQDFSGEIQNLDQFIALSGLPIPGFGMGESATAKGRFELGQGAFGIHNIVGTVAGVKFDADLKIAVDRKPRSAVEGSLNAAALDLEFITAIVHGNSAAGSEQPAAQPLFSGVDGSVVLTADQLLVSAGQPPVKTITAALIIRDGDLAINSIKGKWFAGDLSGSVALSKSGSTDAVSGQLSLENADLEEVAKTIDISSGLNGAFSGSGTFEATRGGANSIWKQISASGVVTITDALVKGLSSSAFNPVLIKADAKDDAALSGSAKALLSDELFSGGFRFERTEIPFNVADGVLRANNVVAKNHEASVAGSVEYELASATGEFTGRIQFDAGKEAVVGANPEADLKVEINNGKIHPTLNADLFSAYLGMRASERRERAFDAQRAEILERQRLLRTVRLYRLEKDAIRIAAEERKRIEKLERQQNERDKLEEIRRKRAEIESKRLEAEIKAAEKEASREAALEAGRRAQRQEQIEVLRRQSEDAAKRLQDSLQTGDPIGDLILEN